jgi:hypothetical protein
MKHRLGVSVGVVLLGIGVAPFWMGKSTTTTHPANEIAAASSSGKQAIIVASASDDYIPPLLGITDDDLIDNPRINPVLALTGSDADEEPGRLTFAAENLQRLPVAPSLLLMGGYDAPRLTPFPNPGAPAQGLNLFGGNQFDPTATPSPDNSNHAVNGPAQRPDMGYAQAAPTSINPAAPLPYPRSSPGLAQPMPNPQGPPPGGLGQLPGQNPPAGFVNAPAPAMAPPPAGYAVPPPNYGAPCYGAPPQYPQPEMLAYAGPDPGNPAAAAMAGRPGPGYPQPAPPYAAQGYAPAGYGPQAGYGYGPGCNCQCGRGFGGPNNPYYGANFGGYPQYQAMMAGGQPGYGGYSGYGMEPGFGGGHFGEEFGHGGFGGSSFGCCSPSLGCCNMPVSCCGPEMGSFAMNCGSNCCGPAESYGGCCSSGCCSQRKGLFGRLKDWFKGGSRCNDYDGCCEQPRCGLFCRLKSFFHKKKDGCCYSAPICSSGECCPSYGCGGFEGGFAGGYSGGFGY